MPTLSGIIRSILRANSDSPDGVTADIPVIIPTMAATKPRKLKNIPELKAIEKKISTKPSVMHPTDTAAFSLPL
jgi:hypothetical protein